jgi:FkbM family methyltransferase
MPSLKRRIATLIEQATGNHVVPPHEVHGLPERLFLRRFLDHFAVDCVFDVGANAGQYATRLRREIGFTGHIISFEPIPEHAATLRAAAAADPHWHVEEAALDREAGPATFNIMAASEFSSLNDPMGDQPRVFEGQNAVARRVTVQRSTLAAELPRWRERLGFQRPFLKMDTQGHDLAVVEGAGERIGEFLGLQSELAVVPLYKGSPGFAEMLERLGALGFALSALVPNNDAPFPLLVEIDCVMVRRDLVPEKYRRAATAAG